MSISITRHNVDNIKERPNAGIRAKNFNTIKTKSTFLTSFLKIGSGGNSDCYILHFSLIYFKLPNAIVFTNNCVMEKSFL